MSSSLPILGLAAALLSLAPAPDDAPVTGPVFGLLTTSGETHDGRIVQFTAGGIQFQPTKAPERTFPFDAVVKLTRDGYSISFAPEMLSVVLFPGGDRLYRTAVGGANDTSLEVQSYLLGNLDIPLESILGLVLSSPGEAQVDTVIQRLRTDARKSEVVWLANGDRLTGSLVGFSDKSIEFESGKDKLKIERSGVLALGMDPSLVVYAEPPAGFLEMTLSDGSRLGVVEPQLREGQITAKTRFGASVTIPLSEVSRIHARTPSVAYLSEREVALARYVPYVGPPRPFHRDATIEDLPLRLAGQDYDRGLGTQSRTLLAYRLKPGDKRFQANIGLDDRAGTLGSVVFRVLVDGEERFASPSLSSRDAPKSIDVAVDGAKTLILITEFGERGGVRDLADWVEARIIR